MSNSFALKLVIFSYFLSFFLFPSQQRERKSIILVTNVFLVLVFIIRKTVIVISLELVMTTNDYWIIVIWKEWITFFIKVLACLCGFLKTIYFWKNNLKSVGLCSNSLQSWFLFYLHMHHTSTVSSRPPCTLYTF